MGGRDGGDPWLRKDFVDIWEAMVTHCPRSVLLHFPTNGYLTDKIVTGVHEICRIGRESLIITVSTDRDEAISDRGIEGGWPRHIEIFRRLREIPDLGYEEFNVNIVPESAHYLGNADLRLRAQVGAAELARAAETYGRLPGLTLHPVAFLERWYLKRVRLYLETGETPMRCHALGAPCFIDSWRSVFPCTTYDRRLSLRDVDYDLARIWNTAAAGVLEQEVWDSRCLSCWNPCEAYQSILGNLVRPELGRQALRPAPERA